ncbi:MAG: TatD family hydrolase [Candidatus Paceibacterota bacterium]
MLKFHNHNSFSYFDVHTHLSFQFENDWREAGDRALKAGVGFVNIATDLKSSQEAIAQTDYFGVVGFCSVGLHPTDGNADDFNQIELLADNSKVVAIGECGLDYFHQNEIKNNAIQKELFKKHINLAQTVQKPLMIHCRPSINTMDAYEDLFDILEEYSQVKKLPIFNIHFFAGDWSIAQKFLTLGGYLSFSGVITFSEQYNEIIQKIPLQRLLSETDAPFASPIPFRGKRNEPAYVKYVAEKIADLRSELKEEVLSTLVKNAKNFYKI